MDGRIIDTDIHQTFADYSEITRRLPTWYRQSHFRTPTIATPSPIGVGRKDSFPESGGDPGSDYELLCKQHMDAFGISYGILTGDGFLGVSNHPDTGYANAFASAYNEAMQETWLTYDPRFFGALFVNSSDPQAAASEIRRQGGHPRIVEVLLSSSTRIPLGSRFYWPIYEAAVEMGLPVAIHPGSEGSGISNTFVAGPPTTYLEWHTNLPQNYMGQIVSLVCQGVFEQFPQLRFVALEGGLAWIPGVLWRLDKNWKALRSTVPWLKRLPSEIIVEHVRFSTQPSEEPSKPEHLLSLFEMISAEKTLIFSSDYPHWDNDSPSHSFPKLPANLQGRIFYDNANELYRIEERVNQINHESASHLSSIGDLRGRA